MAKKRKIYTDEFKIEAVELVNVHGYPAREVCRKLGISSSMLYRWREAYQKKGEKAFPGNGKQNDESEVEQLKRQVRQLQMENEVLKKRRTTLQRKRCEV